MGCADSRGHVRKGSNGLRVTVNVPFVVDHVSEKDCYFNELKEEQNSPDSGDLGRQELGRPSLCRNRFKETTGASVDPRSEVATSCSKGSCNSSVYSYSESKKESTTNGTNHGAKQCKTQVLPTSGTQCRDAQKDVEHSSNLVLPVPARACL